MTEHTPGPWTIRQSRHMSDVPTLEIQRGVGELVCTLDNHLQESDARLIAAAPDLLEALRIVDSRFKLLLAQQEHFPSAADEGALDIVRDAIAKVEKERAA